MTPDIAPDYEALLSEAEALTAGLTVWPWPAAAEARLAGLAQAAGWPASAAAQPPPAAGQPRVTVLLEAEAEPRWRALRRALPTGLAEMAAVPAGAAGPLETANRYNRAAAEARGEFLVLLDADAAPQPGWLEHLLAAAEDGAAVVGARLVTAAGALVEVGQVRKLDGSLAARGLGADSSTHSYAPPAAVDAVTHCLLVRRSAFTQAGGLRPGSLAGEAAQDLCQRLRQAGGRVVVEPRARVLVSEARRPAGPRTAASGRTRPAAEPPAGPPDPWEAVRAPLLPAPIRIAILAPYHGPECLWGEALIADNLREALEWRPDVSAVRIFDYARAGEIDAFAPDFIFSFTAWRQPLRFKRGVTLFYIVNFIHEHMPAGQFLTQEDALRMDADLYAANSASVVEYLARHKPTRLLHMAANPRVHRPLPPTPKYQAQVTYLGAYYPGTKGPEVFDRYVLPAAGFDLALWGTAWHTSPDHFRRHWRGELPIADIARLYSSVDIALGLNAKSQAAAGMINNRVFEILACGALLLSDRYPALEAAFGEVAVFTDGYEDTRAKLDYYLRHPEERLALVDRARQLIEAEHTYDHRARDLIQMYADYQRSQGQL